MITEAIRPPDGAARYSATAWVLAVASWAVVLAGSAWGVHRLGGSVWLGVAIGLAFFVQQWAEETYTRQPRGPRQTAPSRREERAAAVAFVVVVVTRIAIGLGLALVIAVVAGPVWALGVAVVLLLGWLFQDSGGRGSLGQLEQELRQTRAEVERLRQTVERSARRWPYL